MDVGRVGHGRLCRSRPQRAGVAVYAAAQTGDASYCGVFVIRRSSVPSIATVQMSPSRTNAIRVPSGDHVG